jgi:hypothetical protein
LDSVGRKQLVLNALQPPPCGLLISIDLRCFDRYKIVYSLGTARDSIQPFCVQIGDEMKDSRRIQSCAKNGEQVNPYDLLHRKALPLHGKSPFLR